MSCGNALTGPFSFPPVAGLEYLARVRSVVAVGLAAVLGFGVAGCGAGEPEVRSRAQTEADVARYAGSTAQVMLAELEQPKVASTACGRGGFAVRGDYLVPMWIRYQARKRATLRSTWVANQFPITKDESPDGWLGTIATVTSDGYRIDVTSAPGPKPTHLAVTVESPCSAP